MNDQPVVYVGTKLVWGKPMTHHSFLQSQGKAVTGEDRDGYQVTYDDGYVSWSPEDVFERCYRPLTDSEKLMIPQTPQA